MHEAIVAMATMFSILPDTWSLTLLFGEVTLHGDGSFITGTAINAIIY